MQAMNKWKRLAATLLVFALMFSFCQTPLLAYATETSDPTEAVQTLPQETEPPEPTESTDVDSETEPTTQPTEAATEATTESTEAITEPTTEATTEPTEAVTEPTTATTEPTESTTEPTEVATEPTETTDTLTGNLDARNTSVSVALLGGNVVPQGTPLAVTPSAVDEAGLYAAVTAVGVESIADSCSFRLDIPDVSGMPMQVKLTFHDSTFRALGTTSVYVVELKADGTVQRLEASPVVNEQILQEVSFQVASFAKDSCFLVFSGDFATDMKVHSIVGNWAVQGFKNVSCGQATRLHDITYHYVTGKDTPGYCLEPHMTFGYATSGGATSDRVGVEWWGSSHGDDVWGDFSTNQRKAIALIAMLGVNQNTFDWSHSSTSGNILNPTNPNQCDFAAAQIMVWEVVGGYRSFPDPSYCRTTKLIDNWDRGNVRDSYDALNSRIEDWMNTTSGQRVSLEDSEFRVSWVTSSDQVVLTVGDFAYETVTPPTPPTGDLKVTKNVNGSGSRQNWRFEIYSSRSSAEAGTNVVDYAYTNSSGVASFYDIPNGTYYVREAPASRQDRVDTTGWKMSTSILQGTVNGNTISVGSVTNTAPVCAIEVKKGVSSEAGTSGKLNNWKFQVAKDSSFSDIVATLTTDSSGKASTGMTLTPGTYYVREAPLANQSRGDKNQYVLDHTIITVKASANQTVLADHNGDGFTAVNSELGELTVQKAVRTTTTTSGKLDGWKFQVAKDSGFSNIVATLTTDNSGKATTGKTLSAGTYYVREAPYELQTRPDKDKFILDNSVCKAVVPAGGVVQVLPYNNATAINPEKGRIRVSKGVEGIPANADSLSGWVFLILNEQGEEVTTVTTGADGFGTTEYLPDGNYTVQEAPRERQTRPDLAQWTLAGKPVSVTVEAGSLVDAFLQGQHTAVNYHGKLLQIQKVSDCPDEIKAQLEGNAMYSLAGAKYDILVDGAVVETLVTDAEGKAASTTLFQEGDTGILVEKEAPAGYLLNDTPIPFTIPGGTEDYVVEVSDEPTFDPVWFALSKVDATTGTPMGDANFTGAVFRWDYFDNLTHSGVPVRTWYFVTDDTGMYRYAPQCLADAQQYQSDELYQNGQTDAYELPLGSVTVTEIVSPLGYTMIPQLYATITQSEVGSVAQWTWSEESAKYLTEVSGGFEIPEPQDKNSFGSLSIQKKDKDLGFDIPESVNFAGCEFSVYNRSSNPVKVGDYQLAQPGEVCYVLTTDDTGAAATDAIFPVGSYEVKETKGNDFFTINEEWSYTFSVADGQTQFATECANTMISVTIHVQKANEAGDMLEGARFVLEWSEDGTAWTPVSFSDKLSKGGCSSADLAEDGSLATDATGYATFSGLYPLGFYRITEVATPNGYSLLTEPILVQTPTFNQGYEVTYKVVDGYVFNLPKTGVADMPLLSVGIALCLVVGTLSLAYWKKKEQ